MNGTWTDSDQGVTDYIAIFGFNLQFWGRENAVPEI
jgi:hypothetical protein